ncbi:MAG: class I SAM-dependent methyltransferase [Pirellulales bacterium]|nr:class I SAM-dependent methyltransferase [Pirellulales bacterium]
MTTDAREVNRRVWDAMVDRGQAFTRPARDEEFSAPLAALDSRGWLGGSVAGRAVLCLASGGGRQGPLFAAAGARVTVVDLSPAMLALDRQVAAERRLTLETVEASMDDLSMLPVAAFDVVYQPVSTCYVPDVATVYREVARVTVPGGIYISQHKQPASLQASLEPGMHGVYQMSERYYREGALPAVEQSRVREAGTHEFLHRWQQLVGELCHAGFVIEDLVEPFHADAAAEPGTFAHRACYVPPYVRIKARRESRAVDHPHDNGANNVSVEPSRLEKPLWLPSDRGD